VNANTVDALLHVSHTNFTVALQSITTTIQRKLEDSLMTKKKKEKEKKKKVGALLTEDLKDIHSFPPTLFCSTS
jgi:hypothetical protein